MFLFPLLCRGIICIALVLRYRVLLLCPENKTQVNKTEQEAFVYQEGSYIAMKIKNLTVKKSLKNQPETLH